MLLSFSVEKTKARCQLIDTQRFSGCGLTNRYRPNMQNRILFYPYDNSGDVILLLTKYKQNKFTCSCLSFLFHKYISHLKALQCFIVIDIHLLSPSCSSIYTLCFMLERGDLHLVSLSESMNRILTFAFTFPTKHSVARALYIENRRERA